MNGQKHWMVRPENVRKLWMVFIAILAATVLVQLLFGIKGHFGIDGVFGFFAAFGFFACVAMVVFAKVLGVLLKRRDTYYDDA